MTYTTMYVGPWQEYALSKRKNILEPSKEKSKADAAAFKAQMESAILKSLDPLSAARALNAMQEVLKEHTVPSIGSQDGNFDNLNKRRPPRLIVGQTAAYKLSIPGANSEDQAMSGSMSERHRETLSLTPISVRSTASEPVQVRLGKDKDKSNGMVSLGQRVAAQGSLSARTGKNVMEEPRRQKSLWPKSQHQRSHNTSPRQVPLTIEQVNAHSQASLALTDSLSQLSQHMSKMQDLGFAHQRDTNNLRTEDVERALNNHDNDFDSQSTMSSISGAESARRRNQPYRPSPPTKISVSQHAKNADVTENDMGNRQPAYNSSAAVNALRLARTFEKSKQAPDYSAFWEWNNQNNQENNSSVKEDHISKKVERVKRMQQLYIAKPEPTHNAAVSGEKQGGLKGQSALPNDKGVATPNGPVYASHTIQHSPVRRPITPTIGDIDLTDTELRLISKYFDAQSLPNASNTITNTSTTDTEAYNRSNFTDSAFHASLTASSTLTQKYLTSNKTNTSPPLQALPTQGSRFITSDVPDVRVKMNPSPSLAGKATAAPLMDSDDEGDDERASFDMPIPVTPIAIKLTSSRGASQSRQLQLSHTPGLDDWGGHNAGGLDGLLNWSSGLELDDI